MTEVWREFKANMVTQNLWLLMENATLRTFLRIKKGTIQKELDEEQKRFQAEVERLKKTQGIT